LNNFFCSQSNLDDTNAEVPDLPEFEGPSLNSITVSAYEFSLITVLLFQALYQPPGSMHSSHFFSNPVMPHYSSRSTSRLNTRANLVLDLYKRHCLKYPNQYPALRWWNISLRNRRRQQQASASLNDDLNTISSWVNTWLVNINWRDVQTKNVANNVDMSCLRAPWQNCPYKN